MTEYRNPFLMIAVGAPGTGKSTLAAELMQYSERTLVIPANVADAAKAYPGIPSLAVKGIYEADELDPKGKERLQIIAPEITTFKGTRLLHVVEDDRRFSAVVHPYKGYRDGLLVLDDMKKYIPNKGDLPKRVVNYFSDRRHNCVDVYIALHNFDDVARQWYGWGAELVIFRTDLPPGDAVKKKVRNYDQMLEVIERVNRIAQNGEPHYCEHFLPSCSDDE